MNYTQKFYNTYIAKYKKGGRISKAEEGEKVDSYIYTVQRKDSPWSIARKAGISLKQLANYNPNMVNDDGSWKTLHVGDQIYTNTYEYLPAKKIEGTTYKFNVINGIDRNDNSQPFEYTVKRGDTLSKIALRNGTNVQSLLYDNPGIKNRDKIYVGQKIIITPNIVGDSDYNRIIHTIKPGEKTYDDIEKKYKENGADVVEIISDYGSEHKNLVKGEESWRQDDTNLSPGHAIAIKNTKIPEGYYLIQKRENQIKLRPLIHQNDKLIVDNVRPIIVPKKYEWYSLLSDNDNINRVALLEINDKGQREWTILK